MMETAELEEDCCVRAWAASGAMHLTGASSGKPSVAPAGIVRPLAGLADTLASATRALGCEVRVDPVALTAQRAAFTRFGRQGSTSVGGYAHMLRSADGWVVLNLPRPSDVESLPALVGADINPGDWPAVTKRLAAMPTADVVERASLLGMAVAAVGATAPPEQPWRLLEVHADCVAARDAVTRRSCPGGVDLSDDQPPRALQSHTGSGLVDAKGVGSGRAAPVVVDLTSLWAGPLAGGLLAAAGCRVLKVESVSRPDGARRGPLGFFSLLNGGKEQLHLRLGEPKALNRLGELIAEADLVLESSRPRVMQQWGIDPAEQVAQGRVWVSITGHGRCGNSSNRVAFGDDAAASANLVVRGDHADPPMFVADAIADPIAGLAAATAAAQLLAAGRAALVDVSLAGAAAWVADQAGHEVKRPVVQRDTGWEVQLTSGPVPVLPPAAAQRLAAVKAPPVVSAI